MIFEKHTGNVTSFIDLGETNINTLNFQKKKILLHIHFFACFFARSVISKLKYSLAYFATNTASAAQLIPNFCEATVILELM